MSTSELLHKILDQSSQANARLSVIESKQETQIEVQKEIMLNHKDLSKSHYALKNDFGNHKNRFLWITGILGSLFGAAGTFLWNLLTGK